MTPAVALGWRRQAIVWLAPSTDSPAMCYPACAKSSPVSTDVQNQWRRVPRLSPTWRQRPSSPTRQAAPRPGWTRRARQTRTGNCRRIFGWSLAQGVKTDDETHRRQGRAVGTPSGHTRTQLPKPRTVSSSCPSVNCASCSLPAMAHGSSSVLDLLEDCG